MIKLALATMIACVLLASALAPPAKAQDCTTIEAAQEAVEAAGGRVAGAVAYDGSLTDVTLVVETETAVMLLGFRDGCLSVAAVLEPRATKTGA